MKKTLTIIALAVALLTGCTARQEKQPAPKTFHDDIRLSTTPVKQQQGTELCWVFAMLATIETEHIMRGDSIDLSPAYVARMYLLEQTLQLYSNNKGQAFNTRGMMTMLPQLLERYGAMPYTSYRMPDKVDTRSLCRKLQRMGQLAHTHRSGREALADEALTLLDDALGPASNWVFMYGCQYTPVEFAHSVMGHEEYVALTSFSHHPWESRFALEVPDNKYHDDFLNVRIDTLMNYIDRALDTGHPVCWEGDISEPGFSFHNGYAHIDNESQRVTQETRQKAFDLFQTTDDHCMAIVGRAHDENGRKYYLCKNSWGENNPYNGYIYLSENYVRAKTIAIMLPSPTLPSR